MAGNGNWKIARGRSIAGAQLPLAVVAVLALGVILLGKAEASIFDRARAQFSDWMAPALDAVREPLAAIERWISGIDVFFSVYEENLRLKEENERLRQWQNAALALEKRVERYQLLLNAVPDPETRSIVARVIGNASRPFIKTVILNAGKLHGVRPGQAVIDERGMIGRIYLAGETTSWVIMLTDLNSRIPVLVGDGNARAILAGDNSPAPVLDSLEPGAVVMAGERVISSGDGGLLPPGLPVGQVIDEDGVLRVALYTADRASDYVSIVDYAAPAENVPAPEPGDLPVAFAPSPGAGLPGEPPGDVPGDAPEDSPDNEGEDAAGGAVPAE